MSANYASLNKAFTWQLIAKKRRGAIEMYTRPPRNNICDMRELVT